MMAGSRKRTGSLAQATCRLAGSQHPDNASDAHSNHSGIVAHRRYTAAHSQCHAVAGGDAGAARFVGLKTATLRFVRSAGPRWRVFSMGQALEQSVRKTSLLSLPELQQVRTGSKCETPQRRLRVEWRRISENAFCTPLWVQNLFQRVRRFCFRKTS